MILILEASELRSQRSVENTEHVENTEQKGLVFLSHPYFNRKLHYMSARDMAGRIRLAALTCDCPEE